MGGINGERLRVQCHEQKGRPLKGGPSVIHAVLDRTTLWQYRYYVKHDRTNRRQVAALPIKADELGSIRVLLITSRETRRWVIPKGWRMRGLKAWEAAAIEAREEAGVFGKVKRTPIGHYEYFKRLPDRFELVDVMVYLLRVTRELDDWPERDQRQSLWLPPVVAASLVEEPQLAGLISGLVSAKRLGEFTT